MMSLRSKSELLEVTRPRYIKAKKAEKGKILDEFIASTGYHRKYAIKILKRGRKGKSGKKGGRRRIYRGEVIQVLIQVWEICGRICSKRLKPFIPELLAVLERHHELELAPETKASLCQMSAATIDRCLRKERFDHPHGFSTTKPGTLLKNAIPVRTFFDWNDLQPGFLEVDLVAHCGNSVEGQFIYTLTATDIYTGWTECLAVPNRTQSAVFQAILDMRQRLPFPVLGIDSDNGAEFINDILYRYCMNEHINFTRSHPYRKNDQAHVEQKNWSVVRHLIGYDRFETHDQLSLLNNIYLNLRLYSNFFQPVLKLIGKEQRNNKTIKHYDLAITPFRRVVKSEHPAFELKAKLSYLYLQLNPVKLRNIIDDNVAKLWKIAR